MHSDVDRGADPRSRTGELLGASASGKEGKDPQEKHEPATEGLCLQIVKIHNEFSRDQKSGRESAGRKENSTLISGPLRRTQHMHSPLSLAPSLFYKRFGVELGS